MKLYFSQGFDIVIPSESADQFRVSNGVSPTSKKNVLVRVTIFSIVLVVLISGCTIGSRKNQLLAPTPTAENTASSPDQMFDHLGRYIMHNFDQKKPMANFLSGLSGFWGVPMVS